MGEFDVIGFEKKNLTLFSSKKIYGHNWLLYICHFLDSKTDSVLKPLDLWIFSPNNAVKKTMKVKYHTY